MYVRAWLNEGGGGLQCGARPLELPFIEEIGTGASGCAPDLGPIVDNMVLEGDPFLKNVSCPREWLFSRTTIVLVR